VFVPAAGEKSGKVS